MCGISAYIGRKAVTHVVESLQVLEIRGYDSTGIASWDGEIQIMKDVGYVKDVFNNVVISGEKAIGHVRWATHGEVSQKNAHPQIDCHMKIAVCHNGVIENFEKIKAALPGYHRFHSDTDTEVISHYLEDRDLILGIIEISDLLEGYNSFVVLSEDRIVASCGGPPLLVAPGELASEASALTSSEFVALQKGDIVEIATNNYIFHRGCPGPKIRKTEKIVTDHSQTQFSTMFEKEIYEQPESMNLALNNGIENLEWVHSQMKDNLILVGAGSSKVACMWAKYRFMQLGLNVEVIPPGEWLSRPIPRCRMIIAVSQSGETGTLVSLVDSIRDTNLKLVSVVNTQWSFLALHSDKILCLFCGEEKSVIASKSFMSECVVLGQIAAYADGKGRAFDDFIKKASSALTEWLPMLHNQIAKLDTNFERCFVCGEGEFYPIAHEGAMKLKEGAYIFAEPIVASEFKHEALPLISNGEVILWVGETIGGGISTVAEMRARGAKVIGISVEDLGFDVHIKTPKEVINFAPLSVVPFQLLTLKIAKRKAINVDRPRNLAKAVTVR